MKMLFKFRKLYQRVEKNWFSNAIVQYHKNDYEHKIGGYNFSYVNKTCHRLIVDLWFIVFRFEWYREHKDPWEVDNA